MMEGEQKRKGETAEREKKAVVGCDFEREMYESGDRQLSGIYVSVRLWLWTVWTMRSHSPMLGLSKLLMDVKVTGVVNNIIIPFILTIICNEAASTGLHRYLRCHRH